MASAGAANASPATHATAKPLSLKSFLTLNPDSSNPANPVDATDPDATGLDATDRTVTSADLPRLAQVPPGENVRFRLVSQAEARAELRAERERLEQLERTVRGVEA